MIYSHILSIPKNTSKYTPTTHDLNLPHGIIHRLIVGFPPGCNATAHLAVFHKEHQIFPSDPDEDFAWGAYVMDWPEFYSIEDAPYFVSLRGWNDSTQYSHAVWIAVGVLPREVLLPASQEMGILKRLGSLIFGK